MHTVLSRKHTWQNFDLPTQITTNCICFWNVPNPFGSGLSVCKHVEPRRQGIPGFGTCEIGCQLTTSALLHLFSNIPWVHTYSLEEKELYVKWKSIPQVFYKIYSYTALTYAQAHLEKVCLKVLHPCPNRCDPTLQLTLPEVSSWYCWNILDIQLCESWCCILQYKCRIHNYCEHI